MCVACVCVCVCVCACACVHVCVYITLSWTAVDVPYCVLLYPTGAASSDDHGHRSVLRRTVHSVGKSHHPQHGLLREWATLP